MSSLLGGIDESGRGCLAGPLVVAGVSASRAGVRALKELGVKDSKELSPKVRQSLYGGILKVCDRVFTAQISPPEIDDVVRNGKKYHKLNYLEATYFAKVVDQLDAKRVIVDASDTSPSRFRDVISKNMTVSCKIEAFHKADRNFPVVSAASIVAKVQRDREVSKLRRIYGDFGSGYPSDPLTRTYFIERMRRGEPLPEYVRKSWKTWARFEERLSSSA